MTLPRKIRNVKDAIEFFTHLVVDDRLVWHPDDAFGTYVDGTGKATFTDLQAARRNRLMEQAWEVLEKLGMDIYCLGMLNDARLDPGFRTPEELHHLCDGCEKEAEALDMCKKSWSPRKSGEQG